LSPKLWALGYVELKELDDDESLVAKVMHDNIRMKIIKLEMVAQQQMMLFESQQIKRV